MGTELHDEALPAAMGSAGLVLVRCCGREEHEAAAQGCTALAPRVSIAGLREGGGPQGGPLTKKMKATLTDDVLVLQGLRSNVGTLLEHPVLTPFSNHC